MARSHTFHLLVTALLLSAPVLAGGCASAALDLAENHPARPAAAAGASADPAALLAASSLREGVAATASRPAIPQEADGTRENPYIGQGVIRSVGDNALVIQHEAIPGLMGAMTMSYPLAGGTEIGTLKSGDAIRFRIEESGSGEYRIFSVEAMAPGGTHNHTTNGSGPPSADPQREEQPE